MMNVMKFFRKHNRKILGVVMAFLMVVFLGGSALQSMLTPDRNEIIAQTRFGAITEVDRQLASGSTALLEQIGIPWSQPFGPVTEQLTAVDWVIATREAEHLGARRGVHAMRNLIADKNLSERIEEVAARARRRPELIFDALGQLESIRETSRAVVAASMPSEAEVRSAARQAFEKVRVNLVLLTANMFIQNDEQVPEEEIQSHFQKYREVMAGRFLDFGYRIGPAVKVQYYKIDRDAIARTLGVPNAEAKAKKYYEDNRTQNPLFFKTPDELQKEEAENAAAGMADPKPKVTYKDWDAAKDIALKLVKDNHAEDAAKKIAEWLIEHMGEAWAESETGEDGYKVVPAGVSEPGVYDAALARIPKNLAFPDAVTVKVTNFVTAAKGPELEDIGKASVLPERGRPGSITSLAFKTKGIIPKVPAEEWSSGDYLAPFQTSSLPLQDGNRNVYVFRVLETKDGYVPSSVDEVRDRVVLDLKLLHGYQKALAWAEGLRSCTPDVSLKQAFESDTALNAIRMKGASSIGTGYFEPKPFSRTNLTNAAAGIREPNNFLPGTIGPVTQNMVELSFALEDAENKSAVVELRDRTAVVVVEWKETLRLSEEEFFNRRDELIREMNRARVEAAVSDWLSPEKLRARNGFKAPDGVRLASQSTGADTP